MKIKADGGSVLSPMLFNLYTNDELQIQSKRFIFADDWAIVIQCKTFEEGQETLEQDLKLINDYFTENRLKMNPSKSEVCAFHLNNKEVNRKLEVKLQDVILSHNFHPKYLGITLDRSLTYNEHLTKTALKMRTRINIIQKLAGSTWGANPEVLRESTLGLFVSVGDYGCPIWMNSYHTGKIDTQVNAALRVITGTVKSTPISWLNVLSNITPSILRRNKIAKNLLYRCEFFQNSLLYEVLQDKVQQRFKSRKPIWQSLDSIRNYDAMTEWRVAWDCEQLLNSEYIIDPTVKVNGFSLTRKNWVTLNRIRVNHGRCSSCLFKWGIIE